MELDLISPNGDLQINKIFFHLREAHSNGLLLQLHKSFLDNHGERKKCRFLHSTFSENNLLAASDTNGNIYIIDMDSQKYWQIPNKGCVSAISFLPVLKSNLIIALQTGVVQVMHIETGIINGLLVGHTTPVREISFSNDGKYCLTSNSTEAIIWEMYSWSQAHKLALRDDILLKKALFMPVQDDVFACFEDDAMHVWKFGSFECFKQIIPEDWKTHHIKSIAFTKNGRTMLLGGCTQNIAVFCLDTWSLRKIIELPDTINGVKHLQFLPQPFDGGANKILGIVTSASELCFLDIESSLFLDHLPHIVKLVGNIRVSPNGKYLACMMISGEIDIYLTQKLLMAEETNPIRLQSIWSGIQNNFATSASGNVGASTNKIKRKWLEELRAVHKELKKELTLERLIPILKQFGEYPESYRIIIWRTILQLPMNQEAFISLSNKEYHPSYANVESKYPLVNKALSNALKRVLSSLAYWCPLFGEVSFLPEFVFPFVKLLHLDPFACFESVATVIVNWCQNWFEFYPFPPINILTIIENVLGHHDSDLLGFYYQKKVTTCSYACSLMQTAFSEVLTKKEWLRLWDHIISNEPAFIYMVIVAYNIVCRNLIKNCGSCEEIEEFFHKQNVIDIKLLLSKSYYFMDKTPDDIHPRKYLSLFSPLEKGHSYTAYESYPKLILDQNAARLRIIEKQEQELIEEQRKAIAIKKELEMKLHSDHEADFKEEILAELDERFREIVRVEEERISGQRKKLQNLRRELKLKELAVLEELRDQMLKKKSQKKEIELKRLQQNVAVWKARDECEFESVEDEIRKYYSGLLMHKLRLKLDLDPKGEDCNDHASKDLKNINDKFAEELNELQDEVAHAYYDKKIEFAKKIDNIKDMLQKIENDMVRGMIGGDEKNNPEIETLLKETEAYERKLTNFFGKSSSPKLETTGRFRREISDIKEDDYESGAPNSGKSKGKLEISDILQVKNFNNQELNAAKEGKSNSCGSNKSNLSRGSSDSFDRSPSLRNSEKVKNYSVRKSPVKFRSKFTECSVPRLKNSISEDGREDISGSEYVHLCKNNLEKRSARENGTSVTSSRSKANVSEIDFSTLTNNSDNFTIQVALTERQKLVDEAKRSEKFRLSKD